MRLPVVLGGGVGGRLKLLNISSLSEISSKVSVVFGRLARDFTLDTFIFSGGGGV